MPTITVRNVPAKVVQSLKVVAKRNKRSMEQEVRELLERHFVDRRAALEQIDALRRKLIRPATAEEIDAWIEVGRP